MPAILGKILERGKRLGENGLSYGNEHRVKIGPRVLVLGDFLVYVGFEAEKDVAVIPRL